MTQEASVVLPHGAAGGAHWLRQAALVLVGTGVLTASSYISIPMVPVPVSMQTFAVLMVGALYGWRLGGITVLAWLLEAALACRCLRAARAGSRPSSGRRPVTCLPSPSARC